MSTRRYKSQCLVIAAIVVLMGAIPAVAGVPADDPTLDHLTCYPARHTGPVEPTTKDLRWENQFGLYSCTVEVPSRNFCAETRKNAADDPRHDRAGDFMCYRVLDCVLIEPDPRGNRIVANDQFGDWEMRLAIKFPRQLCTPAVKLEH